MVKPTFCPGLEHPPAKYVSFVEIKYTIFPDTHGKRNGPIALGDHARTLRQPFQESSNIPSKLIKARTRAGRTVTVTLGKAK